MDPAAPAATTTPKERPSIAHTTASSAVGNSTPAILFAIVFAIGVLPPGADARFIAATRGVATASPAPRTPTPTDASIGRDVIHATSRPPPWSSPSTLDTTASITRDSTSSTIAATHTRFPSGLVSSPSVWSTLVAIPMEVELSEVPAATPAMTP